MVQKGLNGCLYEKIIDKVFFYYFKKQRDDILHTQRDIHGDIYG